jgi:hypothetical protein
VKTAQVSLRLFTAAQACELTSCALGIRLVTNYPLFWPPPSACCARCYEEFRWTAFDVHRRFGVTTFSAGTRWGPRVPMPLTEKEHWMVCDESVSKGARFSNFYGRVLVGTRVRAEVENA